MCRQANDSYHRPGNYVGNGNYAHYVRINWLERGTNPFLVQSVNFKTATKKPQFFLALRATYDISTIQTRRVNINWHKNRMCLMKRSSDNPTRKKQKDNV